MQTLIQSYCGVYMSIYGRYESLFAALNYLYNDFGSTISVNLIGPLKQSENKSHDNIMMYAQTGDDTHETMYFDITTNTRNDQTKPDRVTFDIDTDTQSTELNLSLHITNNAENAVSFQLFIDAHSLDTETGAICGGIILILLNVLIISEVM